MGSVDVPAMVAEVRGILGETAPNFLCGRGSRDCKGEQRLFLSSKHAIDVELISTWIIVMTLSMYVLPAVFPPFLLALHDSCLEL